MGATTTSIFTPDLSCALSLSSCSGRRSSSARGEQSQLLLSGAGAIFPHLPSMGVFRAIDWAPMIDQIYLNLSTHKQCWQHCGRLAGIDRQRIYI